MTGTDEASVSRNRRQKLRESASFLGIEVGQAIQYYAIERFLYRLSKTQWSDRLVVKGATMLRVWDGAIARPTRDIDFLGRLDNSPSSIRGMILDCLAVEVDDGLTFYNEVHVREIVVANRYPGLRAKIRGEFTGARFVIQLDVGIDDAVVPDPGWFDYPTLIDDESPRILAYQPATAVSEKFEAMVNLGLINSRMRDFFDIWMLAGQVEFRGADLVHSLRATFERRGTELPVDLPPALTVAFTSQSSITAMWRAYQSTLANSGIHAPSELEDVIALIAAFLMPVARAAGGEVDFSATWIPGQGWTNVGRG